MRFAGNFDKGIYTIVTPIPKPKRSMFRILHPVRLSVWLAMMGCLVTMTMVLYTFAKWEEGVTGRPMFWSNMTTSGWYLFSTLIGENVTPQTNFKNAAAVRYLNNSAA